MNALTFEAEPFEMAEQGNPQVSVGTISASDYVKWVQRSLNRLYGLSLLTDGVADRESYRAAVRRFNREYSGRDYQDIDERSQNDLIYANEGDERYLKWVVARLNQVGLGPLAPADSFTAPIVSAIKVFQGRVGLKVPGKQDGDGYVGAKTELALIQATGVKPPGDPKKKPEPKRRPAIIKSVSIWLNAFIPNTLVRPWRHVPDSGSFKGKVFLWNPCDNNFYSSDQRSWSKNPQASARMHARVDLVFVEGIVSSAATKKIGLTVRVNRFGNVVCRKRASTDAITVSDVRTITPNKFSFRLEGAGANPCTDKLTCPLPTPDIDYKLAVTLMLLSDRQRAKIRVTGAVDEFPAFEMYAAVNSNFNDVTTLFRREASGDPSDITGGAVRSVDVTHEVRPASLPEEWTGTPEECTRCQNEALHKWHACRLDCNKSYPPATHPYWNKLCKAPCDVAYRARQTKCEQITCRSWW